MFYVSKLLAVLLALLFGALVEASDTIAYYSGPISARHNTQFFKQVQGREIKTLVIRSAGGEVEAGIALGRWVFDRHIDVVIDDYCLSSCANYVFPAAPHKSIKRGAIVAWHGNYHHLLETGLWRDDVTIRMHRHAENRAQANHFVKQQLQRLVAAEKQFFKSIGVDQALCWIGKQAPYQVPDYYFLSAQDMARFGLKQVELPPDYIHTNVDRFEVDIRYIRLDRH